MLDIESYSLHIIHGAFKSGAEKNGCNIKSIFKAVYTILHDTAVRREDFTSATCWVEDTAVADILTEIWESIAKIVRY